MVERQPRPPYSAGPSIQPKPGVVAQRRRSAWPPPASSSQLRRLGLLQDVDPVGPLAPHELVVRLDARLEVRVEEPRASSRSSSIVITRSRLRMPATPNPPPWCGDAPLSRNRARISPPAAKTRCDSRVGSGAGLVVVGPALRRGDPVGEAGADGVEVEPEVGGVAGGAGSRFSALAVHHCCIRDSNTSVTGSPSQSYRPRTSPIGSACMARKSMS